LDSFGTLSEFSQFWKHFLLQRYYREN